MLFPDRLMRDRTLTFAAPVIFAGWNSPLPGAARSLGGISWRLASRFRFAPRLDADALCRGGLVCPVFSAISICPLNAQVAENWIYLASIGFIVSWPDVGSISSKDTSSVSVMIAAAVFGLSLEPSSGRGRGRSHYVFFPHY